ncbi:cation:proton antiporter [Micromonospora radicis]|uniref:Sodium:proton antiporter n=1 Tax=Micromonospora radicis TaxID=1894971 RepID=A0A418MZ54_9ACTN|nr:monovalent cation/H(+) antiporter subunit G [Micromonospora radicis]RIV40244.1 sodium:proton antiporter [Micromonospora radicis]
MILQTVGQILALVGAAIFVAAAVGLHRLPDPYTRTSAVATAAGLGVTFIVAGAALIDPHLSTTVKAVIAIALQLATSAVGGMVIARSAVLSGHRFSADTDTGELTDTDRGEFADQPQRTG